MTVPAQRNPPPDLESVTDWQSRLRAALFDSVTESDVAAVMAAVVKKAKAGDLQAVRLLLSYAVGSPSIQADTCVVVAAPPRTDRDARIQKMAARAAHGKDVFKLG